MKQNRSAGRLLVFSAMAALWAVTDLFAQEEFFEPAKPRNLDELREDYSGNELDFLMGVRLGRADEVGKIMRDLDFTAGKYPSGEITDSWGVWEELSGRWNWKKGMPLEISYLDSDAEYFIYEAYLQARVSDSPDVWSTLAPLLERLVLTKYLREILLLVSDAKELRDLVGNRIDPDARTVMYRFGGGQTAREASICYLLGDGSILKSGHMKILLEEGASSDTQCIDGLTPLIDAAWLGSEYMAKLLLESGADPNMRRQGATPMQAAVQAPHLSEVVRQDMISLLAGHGARR